MHEFVYKHLNIKFHEESLSEVKGLVQRSRDHEATGESFVFKQYNKCHIKMCS